MLAHLFEKINTFIKERKEDLLLVVVITLVGVISFGLGRLSAVLPRKTPLELHENTIKGPVRPYSGVSLEATAAVPLGQSDPLGQYVASKNGTKYHLVTCPGTKQIKEENKIWFQSQKEARAAGFQPASNCIFPPEP